MNQNLTESPYCIYLKVLRGLAVFFDSGLLVLEVRIKMKKKKHNAGDFVLNALTFVLCKVFL